MTDALLMSGGGHGPATGLLLCAERRGAAFGRRPWPARLPDPRTPVDRFPEEIAWPG